MTEVKLLPHAPKAPSSADRWFRCPGSIALIDSINLPEQKEDTFYQAEGTQAHEYFEQLMKQEITFDDIPEDFRRPLLEATESCHALLKRFRMKEVYYEQKMYAPQFADDCYGTADVVAHNSSHLFIADLKYGRGIAVDIDENLQLLIYAILARHTFRRSFKSGLRRVTLCIIQPRTDHRQGRTRTWSITSKELDRWEARIRDRLELVRDPAAARNFLNPGDKQCKWCDAAAAGQCARLDEEARYAFGGDVNILSLAGAAESLKLEGMLKSWMKGLSTRIHDELISGKEVPGFKLVRGRSQRKWTNDIAVRQLLAAQGVDKGIYLDLKLKSFTQLEKIPELREIIRPYIIKPEGSLVIAQEDDARPAETVGSDFEDADEDERREDYLKRHAPEALEAKAHMQSQIKKD